MTSIVQELARRARLPRTPRLYYVPSRMLNAFAVGRREEAALGVTDGLLRRLTTRELTGVLAHEISHIGNDDLRVIAYADALSRITNLFSAVGQLLLLINLPLLFMGRATVSWLVILLLLAAPTLSSLLQLALSRTRERDADLGAVQLTGDPVGLARALHKLEYHTADLLKRIVIPGRGIPDPSVLRTHPKTRDRIERRQALRDETQPRPILEPEASFALPTQFAPVTRRPRRHMMGMWH